MGLGLVGAGGAAAVQEGLRRRLMERAMAQRQAQEFELKKQQLDQNENFRRDQLEQTGQLRQDTLNERTAAAGERQANLDLTQDRALNEAIPAGRYAASPETTPIMGRLVKIGAATPVDERPRVDEGPLLPGDTGAELPAGFEKRASVGQQAAQDAAAAKVEAARLAAEGRASDIEQRGKDRLAQIQASGAIAAGNRGLTDQIAQQRLDDMKAKSADAQKTTTDKAESARQQTQMALDLVNRLETHPGLNKSTGIIDSWTSGFSQEATDANGLRDQLVATLTLPNLGALKGPMSDRDVIFVKQLATRLGNPKLSDSETRKALSEAKTFLQSKSAGQGGGGTGGGGGAPKAGDTKTFPNGAKAVFDGQGWVKQ